MELGDLPITSLPLRDLGDLSEFLLCLSLVSGGKNWTEQKIIREIVNVFFVCVVMVTRMKGLGEQEKQE